MARPALGRIGVFVAARFGSSRLPGKAMLPLDGMPVIAFLLNRLRPAQWCDTLLLATTTLPADEQLAAIATALGIETFRGDPENLIRRYLDAAERFDIDTIVRVTGDCPFVDHETLDYCLAACAADSDFDIASTKGHFPKGIDFEIFRTDALRRICDRPDVNDDHREHLTLYLYEHDGEFTVRPLFPRSDWPASGESWTVDTREDYDKAVAATQSLGGVTLRVSDLIVWPRSKDGKRQPLNPNVR